MMKIIKIFLVLIVLFISIGAVSAEGNFTALQDEIDSSTNSMEITQDYIYDNATDYGLNNGIIINKSDFTINGNGYTIDASNQARIFNILNGDKLTINNLNFINANRSGDNGGAIITSCPLILNNVTFKNNNAENGGAIYQNNNITLDNVTFINNTAKRGGSIYGETAIIVNSAFINSTSTYAPAIWVRTDMIIENTIFENLLAEKTGGALAVQEANLLKINECTFQNTSAKKNGGAIYIDNEFGEFIISNSRVLNSSAEMGGAIVKLDGDITIKNCEFVDNRAIYSGGAIYVSNVNLNIADTLICQNKILTDSELYGGGGIYSDYSNTNVDNCTIINNTRNGIYAYDKNLNVKNSVFSNNGEEIHGVFLDYTIDNTQIDNGTLFLNDTYYPIYINENIIELQLINNEINVETLPSRYDSRDWGWVSPVKNQGPMGACWTFGNCGALESLLLKTTGIEYDLSENNMQNSMLKYSKYGRVSMEEGESDGGGLQYILSWLGVTLSAYDDYDEVGKLSPLISTPNNIHIQDAIILFHPNGTDNAAIKKAILKCGSIGVTYANYYICYNPNTSSYYNFNENEHVNHFVSIVGWDDNYPASNFNISAGMDAPPEERVNPPGDGAWIVKNSYGTEFGNNGYMYMSYYDKSLMSNSFGIAYPLDNLEYYTAIYQTDISGELEKNESNESTISYKNRYNAFRRELISGVGSYFNEGENYILEIYVNDKLAHVQSGTAPFTGYHTVKLTTEIPVKKGDNFTALMNKSLAIQFSGSRQHYLENQTFINFGEGWKDLALENKTISLKVYTKDLAIYTEDLVKIYKNDSKFESNIGVANETVTFEINGGSYSRISDENGTARMAINLNPGNYTIKTTFNGTTVENSIVVLPTLIADNLVKYFRNASQFFITLIDGEGNPVAGKNITMNINGVFYNRLTNENGTAKLNINLNPGDYILTATDPLTGLMMSYNITVLPTLNATDLEMKYRDGSKFMVTVLDGQGKPLANAKVTFNINGVLYTRTSDSEGIAKLNINLMAGKYIITSEYDGLRISNTITIKD